MSEDVEQITKTPAVENVKTKEKDPKKVAAGKKLAEYNRRAKEALKEKMKRDAEKVPEPEESKDLTASRFNRQVEEGWIPEISFTTAISIVGIGLTALNMFMSYRKPSEPPQVILPESNTTLRETVSRVEPQPSKIPVPKMGML